MEILSMNSRMNELDEDSQDLLSSCLPTTTATEINKPASSSELLVGCCGW